MEVNKNSYSFTIEPRIDEPASGWRLRLIDNGREVGGGVFGVPKSDPNGAAAWWLQLEKNARDKWLNQRNAKSPVEAYYLHCMAEARAEAEAEGQDWLSSLQD